MEGDRGRVFIGLESVRGDLVKRERSSMKKERIQVFTVKWKFGFLERQLFPDGGNQRIIL